VGHWLGGDWGGGKSALRLPAGWGGQENWLVFRQDPGRACRIDNHSRSTWHTPVCSCFDIYFFKSNSSQKATPQPGPPQTTTQFGLPSKFRVPCT
jgi:hypothetical protein